jgi:hypothetical protein
VSLDGSLVLPPDVHVIPVADLPAVIRDRLGGGGYAVTHPHVRSMSTLIDDAFADLLREFRTPATVVEAVLRYSTRHALDAEIVLEDAFAARAAAFAKGTSWTPGRRARAVIATASNPVNGSPMASCCDACRPLTTPRSISWRTTTAVAPR